MNNGVQTAACGCGGRIPNGTAGAFYIRSLAYRRREACCSECGSGVVELPAGAGYYPAGAGYYPAGGDAASDAAARERAAREAADRQAALNAFTGLTGAVQSGVTAGQETERVRLQTEAATAQARAESQAAVERARIEAARDLELARMRGAQPNVSLAPLETTPTAAAPAVSQRTDTGEGAFPWKPVAAVALLGAGVWFLSKGGSRRGKRR